MSIKSRRLSVQPELCSEQQLSSCDIPALCSCLLCLFLSLVSPDPAADVEPPAAPDAPAQLHFPEPRSYGCTAYSGPEHPSLKERQSADINNKRNGLQRRCRTATCFDQFLDEFFLHADGDRQLPDLLLCLKKSALWYSLKASETFPAAGISFTDLKAYMWSEMGQNFEIAHIQTCKPWRKMLKQWNDIVICICGQSVRN